jgi:hypothetical protein
MFAMPLYQVKYKDREEWEQISDLEVMERLYRIYKKVTPAIKDMINGKEIRAAGAVYRLKMQSSTQPEMLAVKIAAADSAGFALSRGVLAPEDSFRRSGV